MLKRFTRNELIDILNKLGVKEIATSDIRWECITQAETGKSHPRMNLEEKLSNIAIYRQRIKDYSDKANEVGMNKESIVIYNRAVDLLTKLMTDDEKSDMAYQKELYRVEKNIYNSRSYLEFPLDKRVELNTLYDDFSGVYLYYDDISTLKHNKGYLVESYGESASDVLRFAEMYIEDKNKRAEFLKLGTAKARKAWVINEFGPDKVDVFEGLSTDEEKINFVENNIEFTHCMLGGATSPNWGIGVYGELDPTFCQFDDKQQALTEEYCDFNAVTLAMTLKIRNNDLLQIMQSKIDIDRENLEVVDEREVRGDVYKILKTPQPIRLRSNTFEYMIRYVCPSTGRVYHNLINETSISNSSFYKSGEPSTYIYAWWNINNGGDDPTSAKRVIRC